MKHFIIKSGVLKEKETKNKRSLYTHSQGVDDKVRIKLYFNNKKCEVFLNPELTAMFHLL